MEAQKYALVSSGFVTNVVLWDGRLETWSPPIGTQAVAVPDGEAVGSGWHFDGSEFINPNTAHDAVAASVSRVTMRQARLALLAAGKLANVEQVISELPSPQKEVAKIEWEYSTQVERASSLVAVLGSALGLDDAAMDELFTQASAL